MASVIDQIEVKHKKKSVVDVKSGDTVRVHQKIREGGKERIQIFEGLVIKASRKNSLTSNFTVRRLASGVGVEKTFLIHSPNILKVEVVRRSKVRRNYLTYMRELTGKSARLSGVEFDRDAVNAIQDEQAEAEEAKIHDQNLETHDADAEERAKEKAEEEAQAKAALAAHEAKLTDAQKLEAQPEERAEADKPAESQDKH